MNKKIGNIFKGDKVIWMVFFFLCMISIVEVFSASSGLTYKSQNFISPILKHTVTIVMGLFIAVVTLTYFLYHVAVGTHGWRDHQWRKSCH